MRQRRRTQARRLRQRSLRSLWRPRALAARLAVRMLPWLLTAVIAMSALRGLPAALEAHLRPRRKKRRRICGKQSGRGLQRSCLCLLRLCGHTLLLAPLQALRGRRAVTKSQCWRQKTLHQQEQQAPTCVSGRISRSHCQALGWREQ